MKFQIASDLHLEFYDKINISDFFDTSKIDEPTTLILAGDIGYPSTLTTPHKNYEIFLDECSKIFKHIILIAGNHEYYSDYAMTVEENKIRELVKKYNNIYFLQKDEIVIDDIVILGCTLWTYIPDKYKFHIKSMMNDYKKITYIEDGKEYFFNHEYNNKLNKEHIQWLFDRVEKYSDKKIIVITHHLPSWKMIHEKYLISKDSVIMSWAFANNLDELIEKNENICYWICGHSHRSMHKRIGKCDVFLNPKGYPLMANKCENEEYNNSFIFELCN
jgi:sulfur relay (sulfurtransferase) DsrF/TusC family protein